jgi:hypothetical protein
MSPPPLFPAVRHISAGMIRTYWVVSIATLTAPTRAELNAGTDATGEIAGFVGWRLRAEARSIQAAGEQFVTTLDGSLEVDDTRLVFYADPAGQDIRTLLARGTIGHVIFLDGGDVAGRPMDVWRVRVAALARLRGIGDDPDMIDVQFRAYATPAIGVSVPA